MAAWFVGISARLLVQEVSSPCRVPAFRTLRSLQHHLIPQDHNEPTTAERTSVVHDAKSAAPINAVRSNARAKGMASLDEDDSSQSIAHVIAPGRNHVLPGSKVVCGGCHNATLGATATSLEAWIHRKLNM